jgi:DNA-binding SARP family transcriptional activator/tetratricopeptide (TPR) repeat protein
MTKTVAGEIRLFSIGDARITADRISLGPSSTVVFATALYLLLENSKPVSRHVLAELLWPTISVESRRHRLRQTILKLRRAGVRVESVGKSLIRLAHSRIWLEHDEFSSMATLHQRQEIRSLLPLATFEPRLSADYAEWLDRQKAHIVTSIVPLLMNDIARHRAAGEWSAVEVSAKTLLQVVPLNEEATLALAEALAMRGSKHEAQRLLDDYLREIGNGPAELKLQASLMRRRIGEHAAPRSTAVDRESPLVGRASTMTQLVALLKSTKNGTGKAFLLKGDAGIGKSRLIAELSLFATLQGFTAIKINCRPSYGSRPLSAFVELVPLLQALPGAIGCAPDNLQFLDRLTRHERNSGTNAQESTEPAWIFGRIQRALIDLVDAVAHESPVLVQVEDIHWLDIASADLLHEIIDRLPSRILFALTTRDCVEESKRSWPDTIHIFQLDPITKAHAASLVLNIVRQRRTEISQSYLEWCTKVADGNPYFLTELATHWVETHIEHEVPESLSTLLSNRVARLDRDSLQLLQTCALLENGSTLARLEAVLEYEAFQLLRSIDTLGGAGMIVVDQDDAPNSERLVTKHELLSHAALSLLSPPARRYLHRRIAQILEREIDEHFSASTLWDCAKHWQLAGDNQHALDVGKSCADYLLKVGLPVQSSEAYGKSLEFCTNDSQRLDILRLQTTAYYRMSSWPQVIDACRTVRQLQQRMTGAASTHDEIELMELRAQWQTFDWFEAYQRSLECLNANTASVAHRAEAGVMALMLAGYKCDRESSVRIFAMIEDMCATGGVSELVRLQARMVFHADYGSIEDAVASARQLVMELRSRGDVSELFRALCNTGSVCRVAGLFDEAESLFESALDLARTHCLALAEQRAIPPFAHMALETGRIDRARKLYERLLEIPINASDKFTFVQRQALGVRLALHDGKADEALRLLPFTLDEISSDPVFNKRTYNLALLVAVQLATHGRASAEAVKKLEESFNRSKRSPHQAFSAFVLHAALKQNNMPAKARDFLRQYEAEYRREPWTAPRHLLDDLERSWTGHTLKGRTRTTERPRI